VMQLSKNPAGFRSAKPPRIRIGMRVGSPPLHRNKASLQRSSGLCPWQPFGYLLSCSSIDPQPSSCNTVCGLRFAWASMAMED
jgi:hypothetical protein